MYNDLFQVSKDLCNDFIKNKTECDGLVDLMGNIFLNSVIKHNYNY